MSQTRPTTAVTIFRLRWYAGNTNVTQPSDSFLCAAESIGIDFEPGDLDQLGAYLDRLLDTNRRFNLTAITNPDEAWIKHIFDSLTLLPLIASAEARTVIDVGSGGGLPGVPLAIVLPDVHFTLLEATGKKATFLRETVAALELTNVEVISDRAEAAGRDRERFRERFDIAVSRAVGKLATLIEITSPFVKVGGFVLAIRGAKAQEEVDEAKQALHHLHCRVVQLQRTPTGTIVIIEKQRATPKLYPRRPGEPKRSPLR
jgi:16S rRNA (guanine527-N7)-methyltransferase